MSGKKGETLERKKNKARQSGIRGRPSRGRSCALTIGYLAAMSLLLVPLLMRLYQNRRSLQRLAEYEENLTGEACEEMIVAARTYNEVLAQTGSTEGYETLLNFGDDGMMGRITIPSIDVDLPIYHTSDEDVLKKGVGHLESSSLPVGGESTHAVLTGHSGQIGNRLFTDLDLMEIGDVFYIEAADQVLTYEVIQIQIVLPEETQSLSIVSGEDLCTLITCTPYGVNSHRLLVTGRAASGGTDADPDRRMLRIRDLLVPAAVTAETLLYLWALCGKRKERRRGM